MSSFVTEVTNFPPSSLMERIMKKLFPTYLSQGSSGPAVFVLQVWLMGAGFNPVGMIADGIYGPRTVEAVIKLQLDLETVDVDGEFGPETKQALHLVRGINFDSFTCNLIEGENCHICP